MDAAGGQTPARGPAVWTQRRHHLHTQQGRCTLSDQYLKGPVQQAVGREFSSKEGLAASRLSIVHQNWDYRWQQVPLRALNRHKLAGVLHTLIRSRFSPEFTTGQKLIYTGCSTGKVIVGRSSACLGAQADPPAGGVVI
ncbi:DDB1- and CUL4-associated factor 11-like [Coregonus clupeaformis]|uniref:DDB1- and CUL4-associated factor 11-like n=1 Tax=Coregonus clupeaformis TaxID=59861 RepID=UPI001E1C8E99|nr:DDB1- and CUL4-associated factor 11-like [Coregonus clupeaformis]